MTKCRSSGACEIWGDECYKHLPPLALRTDSIDSNDFLFAHPSDNSYKLLRQRLRIINYQLFIDQFSHIERRE
jgi:hypothetical protein